MIYYTIGILNRYIIHCDQKKPLMFSITTLAILGRFLYFTYQWKQEEILYNILIQ